MTESMVEIVARAAHARSSARLDEVIPPPPPFPSKSWENTDEHVREHWRIVARAAILALREPTEAMVKAAWALDVCKDGGVDPEMAWEVMIDAAVKGA